MIEPSHLAKARQEKRFWNRALIWSLAVAVALLFIIAGALIYRDLQKSEDIETLGGQYASLREEKVDLCKDKANKSKPECKTTPPPVEEIAPEADDVKPNTIIQRMPMQTVTRVESLPASEVRKAVERACGGSCDGEDVTAEMVQAAVEAHCSTGACKGDPGDPGLPGEDGEDASDAQVLAAVSQFCSENNCKGDPGPLCPDGYTSTVLRVMTSLTESREILACAASAEE